MLKNTVLLKIKDQFFVWFKKSLKKLTGKKLNRRLKAKVHDLDPVLKLKLKMKRLGNRVDELQKEFDRKQKIEQVASGELKLYVHVKILSD